jgi:hypothetical protein
LALARIKAPGDGTLIVDGHGGPAKLAASAHDE